MGPEEDSFEDAPDPPPEVLRRKAEPPLRSNRRRMGRLKTSKDREQDPTDIPRESRDGSVGNVVHHRHVCDGYGDKDGAQRV